MLNVLYTLMQNGTENHTRRRKTKTYFVKESISDVCFVVKSMQNDPLMGNNSAGGLDEISNADNLWNWFRWRYSLKNAY